MNETDLRLRQTEAGLDIPLHVQPRARRNELAGTHNGALKVRLTAPPVDDAANRLLIEFFASWLSLPKSRLEIKSGLKSRDKVLHVQGLSREAFLSCLQRS